MCLMLGLLRFPCSIENLALVRWQLLPSVVCFLLSSVHSPHGPSFLWSCLCFAQYLPLLVFVLSSEGQSCSGTAWCACLPVGHRTDLPQSTPPPHTHTHISTCVPPTPCTVSQPHCTASHTQLYCLPYPTVPQPKRVRSCSHRVPHTLSWRWLVWRLCPMAQVRSVRYEKCEM